MSYLGKRLFEGETIIHRGRFHWLRYARAWLALVFLGVFIIGIVIFIRDMVRIHTTEFVVTNQRLLFKTGLLSAKVSDLGLDAIEGAAIHQSFFGRLFGYGDLIIEGRGEGEISYPTMAAPADFLAAAKQVQSHLTSHAMGTVDAV